MQVALREQKVLWYYYWHRLFGCALAWFFWDVSFYGNKLFQSTFIKILSPGASILLTLEWTLLNSFISLVRPCCWHALPSSPTQNAGSWHVVCPVVFSC